MKTGVYPYSFDDESDDPFEDSHYKSFPAAIKTILKTCLDRDVANRPSAEDLLDAILICKV